MNLTRVILKMLSRDLELCKSGNAEIFLVHFLV